MSSVEDQIQEIEQNIKESKKTVDFGDALVRLQSNRDFKRVILEGYFNEEAIRLVHLKSDSNMQTPDKQQSILLQIDAIGTLKQYFNTVLFKANLARKSIAFDEQTRDELIEGDADGR